MNHRPIQVQRGRTASVVITRTNTADENPRNPDPARQVQRITQYPNVQHAGKDNAGVRQIRGDQCIADTVDACHRQLRESNRLRRRGLRR